MFRFLIFIVFFALNLLANDIKEVKDIFKKYSIKGTILIESLNRKERFTYAQTRAKVPYSPASTFKIPNTLIALNQGVIKKDDIMKWDGKNRRYPQWNKDQTLESAFRGSCVWCYQEIARKIPKVIYENYLVAFDYGNKSIRKDIDNFWLDGSLKITAFNQMEFLKRFYTYDLAVRKEHIDTTKKLMLQNEKKEYKISYKTGWDGKIGWIVGYVEKEKEVYFFVFNGNIGQKELALREKILYEVLELRGIIKGDF